MDKKIDNNFFTTAEIAPAVPEKVVEVKRSLERLKNRKQHLKAELDEVNALIDRAKALGMTV